MPLIGCSARPSFVRDDDVDIPTCATYPTGPIDVMYIEIPRLNHKKLKDAKITWWKSNTAATAKELYQDDVPPMTLSVPDPTDADLQANRYIPHVGNFMLVTLKDTDDKTDFEGALKTNLGKHMNGKMFCTRPDFQKPADNSERSFYVMNISEYDGKGVIGSYYYYWNNGHHVAPSKGDPHVRNTG